MNPRIILTIALVFLGIQNVSALPSFSRQTGQSCNVCHLSYGELTPQGRKFKLMGYSEGNYVIPLSITGVVSDTKINSTSSSIDPSITMPKNNSVIPEEASIYVAGKFYGKLGGFLKLTLNLSNTSPLLNSQGIQTGTKVGGDTYLDASEIRYANNFSWGEHNLVVGGTLNNAPAKQDLWNISPVNAYPYRSSNLLSAWEVGQFGPSTLIDGGLNSQVAGISIYTMIDERIYAELAGYTRFSTPLQVIALSDNLNTVSNGLNPYWRLAYSHERGQDFWMVGTFGMITDLKHDPEIPGSSGGEYSDIGLDAKYQHITDLHSWSAQITYINEQIDWSGKSVVRLNHDNTHSELHTLKAQLGYNYKHQLGAQLFSFYTNGSTDNNYWTYNQNVSSGACNQTNSQLAFCSANGSPKTSGYGFEIYYEPMSYIHMSLQQTFYDNILGGSTFYDNSSGNLRAAKDNNLTYLSAVLSY